MNRRWFVCKTNTEYIRYLSRAASISKTLSQILINRGIRTPEDIRLFLNPELSQITDPFELRGIKSAVERVLSARKSGERVLIHGDFDVDGLTATAILYETLRKVGIDCYYYIPHRLDEGYGFGETAIRFAKGKGVSLILTVDCGITSFEAVKQCRREGIDVIITDHHEPLTICNSYKKDVDSTVGVASDEFLLPDALEIINPKLSYEGCPFYHLSGAGVALKLAHAILVSLFSNSIASEMIYEFLDLAALGTLADIVPLIGENRVIVKEGIDMLRKMPRPGLKALKEVSGIDGRDFRAGIISFTMIPRLNASGRLSHSKEVIKLLTSKSYNDASALVEWLDKLNVERQRLEEDIFQEAIEQIKGKEIMPIIILSSEGWHRGVIGIVASRIVEMLYRPSIIFKLEGDVAKGSARSIPTFDIFKAISRCKDLLNRFGGHKSAAGVELKVENLPAFEEMINKIALEMLTEDDLIPLLKIDADVALNDIDFNLVSEINRLEPFGFGNPEPLLGAKSLEVLYPKVVKNSHVKMRLRQNNYSIDAIGFDMASYVETLEGAKMIDAVFTPFEKEWEGFRSLQLNLKAVRPTH